MEPVLGGYLPDLSSGRNTNQARWRYNPKSGNYSHKDTKNTKKKIIEGVGPITARVTFSTYILR